MSEMTQSMEDYLEAIYVLISDGKAAPVMDAYLTYLEARQREDQTYLNREFFEKANAWLDELGRGITLNVAGPREIKTPGTYTLTKRIIGLLLASTHAPQRVTQASETQA